jgi:hypothetical protein
VGTSHDQVCDVTRIQMSISRFKHNLWLLCFGSLQQTFRFHMFEWSHHLIMITLLQYVLTNLNQSIMSTRDVFFDLHMLNGSCLSFCSDDALGRVDCVVAIYVWR